MLQSQQKADTFPQHVSEDFLVLSREKQWNPVNNYDNGFLWSLSIWFL